jgi:PAS domain S-box-containing protein
MLDSLPITQKPTARKKPDAIDLLPVAYIELDTGGIIVRANRKACKLFSTKRKKMLGAWAWDFVASDEVEMSRSAFFACIQANEEPQPIRRSLYEKNGEFRVYDIYRNRIFSASGQTIGLRYMLVDVTQSQFEDEQLRDSTLWLEHALASVAEILPTGIPQPLSPISSTALASGTNSRRQPQVAR